MRVFTLSAILVACAYTNQLRVDSIVGKYKHNPFYGIGSTFELKEDSTFEYKWQAGLDWGETIGKWQIEDGFVILNSETQPKHQAIKYHLNKSLLTNSDSVVISVKDEEHNHELAHANVALLKDTTILIGGATNENGEIVLEKQSEADKIQITYIGYYTIEHPIGNTLYDSYHFSMISEFPYYQYFSNSKWQFKGKKMIGMIQLHELYEKRVYKKTN